MNDKINLCNSKHVFVWSRNEFNNYGNLDIFAC